MNASAFRPARNFLGLRLSDVERATGVRAAHLSEAERGLVQLTRGEFIAIRNFLRERLADDLTKGGLSLLSSLEDAHE